MIVILVDLELDLEVELVVGAPFVLLSDNSTKDGSVLSGYNGRKEGENESALLVVLALLMLLMLMMLLLLLLLLWRTRRILERENPLHLDRE